MDLSPVYQLPNAAPWYLLPLTTVVGLFHRGNLPVSILAAYGGVSLVLFLMYWTDKRAAQRGGQRTAEKTLHVFELCCGWPGALLAQQVFRQQLGFNLLNSLRPLIW